MLFKWHINIQIRSIFKLSPNRCDYNTKDAIAGWCLTAVRNGRLVGAKTNKASVFFAHFHVVFVEKLCFRRTYVIVWFVALHGCVAASVG